MSLHLSEEDRATLERLEKMRMKPTRRQKAIALLRLAAGLSPAEAAEHAGIRKDEVELLASKFDAGGLAGVGLARRPGTIVRLVRPEIGVQEFRLEEGATLADLLHRSEATTTNRAVYVDGVAATETLALRDGSVVMIVPQPGRASADEPWRATIPSFRDEELYQQYAEVLKARRGDLGPDEDPAS
jgi:sulfur carrier protein ThiS